jgi:hypothetical protein
MNNKAAKEHLKNELEEIEAAQEQAVRQRVILEHTANETMRQAQQYQQQEAALKERADKIREILDYKRPK